MTDTQQFKNEMHLAGQLVRDPEVRYTSGGKTVAHLTVLTKYEKYSEFHRVVLWEALAEKAAQLTKGEFVQILGRLQTRSWEDKQTNQKKYSTEIVAFNLVIPGKENNSPKSKPAVRNAHGMMIEDHEIPF